MVAVVALVVEIVVVGVTVVVAVGALPVQIVVVGSGAHADRSKAQM